MTQVAKAFNSRPVKGEVGIELEYEGLRLAQRGFEQHWAKVADGSLRGESAEYILSRPILRTEVDVALKELDDAFKAAKTMIADTFRAGTHVHVNVQELSAVQLINMLTLYYMYEDALLAFCRKDRTGNHFCLRTKDASAVTDLLRSFIINPSAKLFADDTYRYASLNLTALTKYGSLEFRSLESTVDWDRLKTWVKLLLALKDASMKFDDPAQILLSASGEGFDTFAKRIFGDLWETLKPLFNEDGVRESVWEIQHAVFSRDWGKVNLNIFAAENIFD